MTIAALAGAGYIGFDLWGSPLAARISQHALSAHLSTAASAPAPAAAPVAGPEPAPVILAGSSTWSDGAPVGRIRIPKIGVDAAVVYGTATAQLAKGPALWKWGVEPGDPGNAMIAAHRTTYGAWFHDLDKLSPGDQIVVSVPGRADAVFAVRGTKIVPAADVAVAAQTAGVRLTLSACHPLGSDKQRIVVQAELVAGTNVAWATPAASWAFQG